MTVEVHIDRIVVEDGWAGTSAQLRSSLSAAFERGLADVPPADLADTAQTTVDTYFGGGE